MPKNRIMGKGKGEEINPLLNQQTEAKGEESYSQPKQKLRNVLKSEVQPNLSTVERLKQEALKELRENETTNAGFNPLA